MATRANESNPAHIEGWKRVLIAGTVGAAALAFAGVLLPVAAPFLKHSGK